MKLEFNSCKTADIFSRQRWRFRLILPTGCLADDEGDDIPAAEGWNYSCSLSRKNAGMNDKKGEGLPMQYAVVQAQFEQKTTGVNATWGPCRKP